MHKTYRLEIDPSTFFHEPFPPPHDYPGAMKHMSPRTDYARFNGSQCSATPASLILDAVTLWEGCRSG